MTRRTCMDTYTYFTNMQTMTNKTNGYQDVSMSPGALILTGAVPECSSTQLRAQLHFFIFMSGHQVKAIQRKVKAYQNDHSVAGDSDSGW